MEQTTLLTAKEIARGIERPVFGVAVQAFGRVGLEEVFSDFKIICLHYSGEIEKMRKDGVEVFCLEEHLGEKPEGPKNPTTLLEHKDTQAFIEERSKGKQPVLMLYKSSPQIDKLAEEKHWTLATAKFPLYKRLEERDFFQEMLQELGMTGTAGEIVKMADLSYSDLNKKYPDGFVLQGLTGGGGESTTFVKSPGDFQEFTGRKKQEKPGKRDEILVARFIEGSSPSMTGCIIGDEVLCLAPQTQLIDIPELTAGRDNSGIFCGHDWSLASGIGEKTRIEMETVVRKIGFFLKNLGFQGIFGIDFLLEESTGKVYPLELNPRLLGTFPVSTLIQLKNQEAPFMFFQALSFMGEQNKLPANFLTEVQKQIRSKRKGAHFFINVPCRPCHIENQTIRAGVYILKEGKLVFMREGYKYSHLENDQEFLLVDGISIGEWEVEEVGPIRILRVVTAKEVGAGAGKSLNSFGRSIVEAVLASLDIQPV